MGNVVDFPLEETEVSLEQHSDEHTAALQKALAIVEAQRCELEAALRIKDETQARLEQELEDARLLHDISSMMIGENSTDALYQKLVDVATLVMRSQFGSLQRLDSERRELEIIAHCGLDDETLGYWKWVYPGRATTCGRSLEIGKRVVVSDFEDCPFIADSEDLVIFRKAGVKAAQSTPLLTRDGRLVGMITTHWTHCHVPSERDLRLFDMIARQAADLIERSLTTEALRGQSDKLIEADRYKDEFLATLAHELRNPLAPIRTGLTLLNLGKLDQASRILPMMERQLEHMVRLLDDLLDVSRISRGMVTLKHARIELSSIIESAVETSRPLINASGHDFTVTAPGNIVWLDVDALRVVQIVSNLLNNAARYTPHGGRIKLIAETIGNEAVISVTDNGIGIPLEMQPKIFELFAQVNRDDERSQSGLGVGLALAKHLAELHQGVIEVASPVGEGGSTFTLRLPIASDVSPDERSSITQEIIHMQGPAARLLVVDDNADAAESMALLLKEMGHKTLVVLESNKVLEAAIEFKPDVIFLDLGMPHLNGFDLARQIRNHPTLGEVFITALSGWGGEDERSKSKDAGMNRHLTKPATIQDVASIMQDVETARQG